MQPGERALPPGKDAFEVRFTATGKDGLEVQKVYTFRRGSYVVDVALEIRNPGASPLATYSYFQLTHDGKPDANPNTVAETFGAQSFIGFAVYTDERKFEKVHPSDLDKGKAEHVKQADERLAGVCAALFRLGMAAGRRALRATTSRRSARTGSTPGA